MPSERLLQVENANDVSFLAEHLLECLDKLEFDNPYLLDSPGARDWNGGDSPVFLTNSTAEYLDLKARLTVEQRNPSVDDCNLRVIYAELKAYLERLAGEIQNVVPLRGDYPHKLIPEIYLHSSFNLMTAVFMKQLLNSNDANVYTALAEDIVLGERNLLSIPQELRIAIKRKILKLLASDEAEEVQVGSDLRNLYLAVVLAMFFGKDEELEEISQLGDCTSELGVEKMPVHRIAANILAARKRILEVRDEVAFRAHDVTVEAARDAAAKGERHLRIVRPSDE